MAARNRAAIEKDVVAYGVTDDGAAWLRDVEEETYAALLARGEATGSQLSARRAAPAHDGPPDGGKPWEGLQGLTTRVLTQLGADGRIVRGRPRGTLDVDAAHVDADGGVARRRAARHRRPTRRGSSWPGGGCGRSGPATVADLRWWTGWSAGEVKRALATIEPVEVDLDGGVAGLVLADDTAPVRAPKPWAALLPALDPTAMGWTGRAWYLGPHAGAAVRPLRQRRARRCGGAGGSWAAGASGPTARWWCGCWKTSAPTPPRRWRRRPTGSPAFLDGDADRGPGSARRWSGSWARATSRP